MRRAFRILPLIAIGGWIAFSECRSRHNDRLLNESLSQQQQRLFETLDGRLARNTEEMQLRWREIGLLLPDLQCQIEAMHISLKRVEQVQSSAMSATTSFTTLLRDSVIERLPGLNDTVRVFSHTTPYLQVEGIARADSQWMRMQMRDTLLQVVYRGKRTHPWLWFFSPRELVQTVRLGNPDAEIRYSRRIRVEKR